MADKRISALTEKTSLGASDYFVTDNASEAASKKVKTSYITDQLAAMQNVYGAKNLVPFPYNDTTKAEDGLTFTDNGDGSVTINGTSSRASGYTYFVFSERQDGDLILPIGDYTYSMEIVSGSITSGEVKALVEKYNGVPGTSDGWAVVETLTNASVSSNFSLSAERNMAVLIRIKFGASLSNLRIRPMIRLACIKDDTYVMYAKTNKEITDELGSTDISSIGNGTVTGGISSLNSALNDTFKIITNTFGSRTFAANAHQAVQRSIASNIPSGYTPLGIIGYDNSSTYALATSLIVQKITVDNQTVWGITGNFINISSNSITINPKVYILCSKI